MTPSFQEQVDAFGRRVQWLVEIELDRCELDYAATNVHGICPVAALPDGQRCDQSFATCQAVTSYVRGTHVLRFCLNEVPWPDDVVRCFPLLRGIVTELGQEIATDSLQVYPERLTLRMLRDYNPPPFHLDKPTHNTERGGEFWRKLKAQNPNWRRRPVRLFRGFAVPGFALADFEQRGPAYRLMDWQDDADGVTLTVESPLVELGGRQVPFALSDDDAVQNVDDISSELGEPAGTNYGISSTDLTLLVPHARVIPKPADYERNRVYLKLDDEIVRVASVDDETNTITLDLRGALGTEAAPHKFDTRIEHVAFFGTDHDDLDPGPRNVMDVVLDLLEWVGIDTADVNTASFDDVKRQFWPSEDTFRILDSPKTVTELLQNIRELRGVLIFIDRGGQWAAKAFGPNSTAPTLRWDSELVEVDVGDDRERELTRASMYYDPIDGGGTKPEDYHRRVHVIDADLEDVRNYGYVAEEPVYDAWIWSGLPTAKVRNVGRRVITRRRAGERTVSFSLDVKNATELDVGDDVNLLVRQVTDVRGEPEARACVVTSRQVQSRVLERYTAVDTGIGGAYVLIGPNDIPDDPDGAPPEVRARYTWWGDDDNRVGAQKRPGSLFW